MKLFFHAFIDTLMCLEFEQVLEVDKRSNLPIFIYLFKHYQRVSTLQKLLQNTGSITQYDFLQWTLNYR